MVSKILGGSLDPQPPINDTPEMNGAQHCLLFCLHIALQFISNCYFVSWETWMLYAGKNVATEHPQRTIA